jgi:hypothetical protein
MFSNSFGESSIRFPGLVFIRTFFLNQNPETYAADLGAAINKLLRSAGKRMKMGAAARKRIEKQFSLISIARQTVDFLSAPDQKSRPVWWHPAAAVGGRGCFKPSGMLFCQAAFWEPPLPVVLWRARVV